MLSGTLLRVGIYVNSVVYQSKVNIDPPLEEIHDISSRKGFVDPVKVDSAYQDSSSGGSFHDWVIIQV